VKALLMASDAHSQQKRKCDGSPYVQHLLEVQSLLVNIGDIRDEDIIIAGLLHDVLEDSETTKRDLLLEFGSRVASIVAALTDDKSLSLTERRDLTINKLEFAPKSIKLIKLADICSNAGALPLDWNKSRVGEYFSWLDQIALICKDANESLYNEYLVRRH
jgi:(p)ppGpp synthase/HD superfamily hydrolase